MLYINYHPFPWDTLGYLRLPILQACLANSIRVLSLTGCICTQTPAHMYMCCHKPTRDRNVHADWL